MDNVSSLDSCSDLDSSKQYTQKHIDFNTKLKFDSIKLLNLKRGELIKTQKSTNFESSTVWDIEPIDFSIKEYAPKPLSKQNISLLKQQFIHHQRLNNNKKQDNKNIQIPSAYLKLLENKNNNDNNNKIYFKTNYDKYDYLKERLNYVRSSIFNDAQYEDFRIFDFRQYIPPALLGLPEFVSFINPKLINTKNKKDLLKLQVKRDKYEPQQRVIFKPVDPGPQMGDYRKTPEQMYDKQLLLPNESYPAKHHEFTRHRRLNRSVHSAFMDRVEEKFNKKWNKDKKFDLTQNKNDFKATSCLKF